MGTKSCVLEFKAKSEKLGNGQHFYDVDVKSGCDYLRSVINGNMAQNVAIHVRKFIISEAKRTVRC